MSEIKLMMVGLEILNIQRINWECGLLELSKTSLDLRLDAGPAAEAGFLRKTLLEQEWWADFFWKENVGTTASYFVILKVILIADWDVNSTSIILINDSFRYSQSLHHPHRMPSYGLLYRTVLGVPALRNLFFLVQTVSIAHLNTFHTAGDGERASSEVSV